MLVSVGVEEAQARLLAAVRRELFPVEIAATWAAAIGIVWEVIRSQPGLWRDGHNIFVYHHSEDPKAPIACDFGVEVTRRFEGVGEVYSTETPAGQAIVAVYRGPYFGLSEAYDAIEQWMAANCRESGGHSWEIYGDPTPNPADTETTVAHLLR